MGKKGINGFYIFIGILLITMLFLNARFFRGSANSNIGITEAREYRISSEKPGIIKEVHVIPGQEVKEGDLLIELENVSLEIEITKLRNHIAALQKEEQEKSKLVKSKVEYFKAESGIVDKDLESEIEQIISEVELNRQLTDQFLGSRDTLFSISSSINPQELKKGSLEEMKKLNSKALSIRIEDLVKTHATEMLMLRNEISLKVQEMELMIAEQKRMNKYATSDGIIENVFVRKGEEVQAYIPYISLYPKSPNSVIAYAVGPKGRELQVGQKVTVRSYDLKSKKVEGEVIGSGAINPLPDILQKSTAIIAFGREIFIKIPEENSFASGEKVLIR